MDIDEQQFKDEQELAKVLAGINDQITNPAPAEPVTPVALEAAPEAVAPEASAPVAPAPATDPLNATLHNAINDLRPLVDKLTIPVEEKFDTYLLLIRSTNDSSLVEPAYQIAKQISDDTKRANALLTIIKEVNYFMSKK